MVAYKGTMIPLKGIQNAGFDFCDGVAFMTRQVMLLTVACSLIGRCDVNNCLENSAK